MFPEWYRTSDHGDGNDALVRLTEATVAFDASALLELYRSDASERAEILGAFTLLGDRLFVPYQAALEYQRRREGAIKDQRDLINSVVSTFESAQTNAARAFNDKTVKARVRTAWETARHAVGELEAALIDEYDLTHDDDDVRDGLDALLTPERLGSEPTSRQSRKRAAAFEERARLQMPPGYCDVVKGAPKMYGDYFIWCELLDKARTSQQPLLFVTEDLKDDWSWRGLPRRELVHEMRSKADAEYHHITLKAFLQLAQKHLSAEITDETIESVSEQPKATIQDIMAASEGLGTLAALKDQNVDFANAVLSGRLWAESRFADNSARSFYLPENSNWVAPLSSAGYLPPLPTSTRQTRTGGMTCGATTRACPGTSSTRPIGRTPRAARSSLTTSRNQYHRPTPKISTTSRNRTTATTAS